MTKQRLLPIVAALALLPCPALAQGSRIDVTDGGDTAWLLACCLLGLLTLPGMALLHAGRVRARNALSVLVQCGAIFALVSMLWIMVGYTLGFGEVGNGWLGKGNAWMLVNIGNVREGTLVPESAFVLFHLVFAALAAIVLTGAWAERARFGWALTVAGLWTLMVYAPAAHWIWGGGWLARGVGTLDWSGGIVLHVSSGVSALVLAVMVGKRRGAVPPKAHSPVLAMIGMALFWIGSLALSGGSAIAANDDAGAAMIAMHMACAASALTWLLVERLARGKPSATGFATGALAGIVTVSPAAGYISPGSAVVFGVLGALGCSLAMRVVRGVLKIDDALGVFAVHGVGGMLGALLLALFLSPGLGGVGYGDGMNAVAQAVAQVAGIAVVAAWSLVATVVLALMTSLVVPMRVAEDAEREGLDTASHGERGWEFD